MTAVLAAGRIIFKAGDFIIGVDGFNDAAGRIVNGGRCGDDAIGRDEFAGDAAVAVVNKVDNHVSQAFAANNAANGIVEGAAAVDSG